MICSAFLQSYWYSMSSDLKYSNTSTRTYKKTCQNRCLRVAKMCPASLQAAKRSRAHDSDQTGISMSFNGTPSIRGFRIWDTDHSGPERPQNPPKPPYSAPTHSLLLWCARRGGCRQTLFTVHQLAVGFPQGSLQLVDAGLVLQQDVLRLIQELEDNGRKK